MGGFFSLDSHPAVYFIIWEMHGFSRQLPIAWEKAGKPIEWDKLGKLVHGKILLNASCVESLGNLQSYISHSMGCFIQLDSYPMVYFIKLGNVLGELGKLLPIFFPNVWVLFFHQMPILSYTLPHGECMASPINYQQHGKIPQNTPCGLSGCFWTVLMFLSVLKSGNSLKEQRDKNDKKNYQKRRRHGCNFIKKEQNKYTLGKVCHPPQIFPYF